MATLTATNIPAPKTLGRGAQRAPKQETLFDTHTLLLNDSSLS